MAVKECLHPAAVPQEHTEPEDETEEARPANGQERNELLSDLTFSRGFSVTKFHSNSSCGAEAGVLDYNGAKAAGSPCWRMAQWGCTRNMVEQGVFTSRGSVYAYDDGGKHLSVDVSKKGCLSLAIKGSVEYTPDAEGNVRERTDPGENWPHILVEQMVDHPISADCKALYMDIEYCVDGCTSAVDRSIYPVCNDLNAAQFQWFITLSDNDEKSESYRQSMWFGFSMFDSRAQGGTPDGIAAYDGGKEDCTGLFIYMPSLRDAETYAPQSRVSALPSAVVGKKVAVRFDILPFLARALEVAHGYGAMRGASVEHLTIGSTNIGWELPGNYDVSVKITHLGMYECF